MSQRAVRVPRVGMGAPRAAAAGRLRAAPADARRDCGADRHDGRPVLEDAQLPVYVPTQSAEERKEELALRNQFKGRTPEEIVAAQRTAPQLFPRGRFGAAESPGTERRSYQVLHDQIADEIAERQRFIDSMRALGKVGQHELRIKTRSPTACRTWRGWSGCSARRTSRRARARWPGGRAGVASHGA